MKAKASVWYEAELYKNWNLDFTADNLENSNLVELAAKEIILMN
jgi:hypothetical protein